MIGSSIGNLLKHIENLLHPFLLHSTIRNRSSWEHILTIINNRSLYTVFSKSGKAPEQGYKACASLTKLGERYGKERLESACARVHAYGTTPSIRNISSILKSKQDVKAKTSTAQEQSSNTARYGITRGASYFANGGEHK